MNDFATCQICGRCVLDVPMDQSSFFFLLTTSFIKKTSCEIKPSIINQSHHQLRSMKFSSHLYRNGSSNRKVIQSRLLLGSWIGHLNLYVRGGKDRVTNPCVCGRPPGAYKFVFHEILFFFFSVTYSPVSQFIFVNSTPETIHNKQDRGDGKSVMEIVLLQIILHYERRKRLNKKTDI